MGKMNSFELNPSTIQARVSSGALQSPPDANSLRSRGHEYHSGDPLDTVIGLRNGVIGGIAIYLLAYLLFSLVKTIA